MFWKLKMTAAALALIAGSAHANEEFVLILPESLGSEQLRLKEDLDDLFYDMIQPGASLSAFNSTRSKLISRIQLPDEARYARAKSRNKRFGGDYQQILDFVDESVANEDAGKEAFVPDFFAYYAENRSDGGTPAVMLVGGALFSSPEDPSAAIRFDEGVLYVPNESLVLASLAESAWGTAGQEQALASMIIHWCQPYGEAKLSTYQHAELRKIWSLWFKNQGAAVVSFTQDLALCVERFMHGKQNVPEVYEFSGSKHASLGMLRVRRDPLEPPVDLKPDWPRPEISVFSEFQKEAHPYMKGVRVQSGTEFHRENWPEFAKSWCLMNFYRNGVRIIIDLGSRTPNKDVVWNDPSANELSAAGISLADAVAARPACRLAGDPA